MAEEPRQETRERPPGPRPVPERQDPKGWRVQPAPDGRGAPEEKSRSPWGDFGRRWLLLVVVLLAINFWVSSLIPSGPERIRIPYTPTFIEQVKAGNVVEISSKGATVQGKLVEEI